MQPLVSTMWSTRPPPQPARELLGRLLHSSDGGKHGVAAAAASVDGDCAAAVEVVLAVVAGVDDENLDYVSVDAAAEVDATECCPLPLPLQQ